MRTDQIHYLSAKLGVTIYSASIDHDLRVIFILQGNIVRTLDIGTHDLYRKR